MFSLFHMRQRRPTNLCKLEAGKDNSLHSFPIIFFCPSITFFILAISFMFVICYSLRSISDVASTQLVSLQASTSYSSTEQAVKCIQRKRSAKHLSGHMLLEVFCVCTVRVTNKRSKTRRMAGHKIIVLSFILFYPKTSSGYEHLMGDLEVCAAFSDQ